VRHELRRVAFTHDAFILGHGIAGAVMAETLRSRGLRVHVFHHERPGAASAAAGGVVNPVVLRRLVPVWRAAELLPVASTFYTTWQERLGIRCWHPTPLVRIHASGQEARQWRRAMEEAEAGEFIGDGPDEVDLPIDAPFGYGIVQQAAWLDVPRLLAAERTFLAGGGMLTNAHLGRGDIRTRDGGVWVLGMSAPWLVRCEGPFAHVPGLVPVKGETLIVRMPALHLPCMVHGSGIFLLPLGGGLFRVGATYARVDVFSGPSSEAREQLLSGLAKLVHGSPEVVDHQAGVRPTAQDRRPILGSIGPHEAVFNGLGSRGVLLAPWCAAQLADHLFQGMPLDPAVDATRFRSGEAASGRV
jgi:glycine/D-amino acid oxidase-like deaminating enzyme